MNNREIIKEIAISEGIVSAEEADLMEEKGEPIPLHTVSGWKQQGYTVKAGEEGIEARLWKKKEDEDKFYKQKSYLYTINQVE